MSLLVATSIQIVGVLLITSLLIIPASTARLFANSPEKMAIFGIIAAALSLFGGILVAQNLAIEAGPTIVTLSVVLFLLALIVQPVLQRLGQQA
jgi:zinc transport system permease protein